MVEDLGGCLLDVVFSQQRVVQDKSSTRSSREGGWCGVITQPTKHMRLAYETQAHVAMRLIGASTCVEGWCAGVGETLLWLAQARRIRELSRHKRISTSSSSVVEVSFIRAAP